MLVGRAEECAALDRLLADTSRGTSRVVLLTGEAGVGKSALLAYVSSRATGWNIISAVGVESEAKLAFSGLHQVCVPMLGQLGTLPSPQRIALETVFGRTPGPPPDRFLVALAALTLLATAAEQQPLICVIDDAHWLDQASAQILGFVARRLLVERIAIVCAARVDLVGGIFAGLPDLTVSGLGPSDARKLLLENVPGGRLDPVVCDQIVAESRGNALALLELSRAWDPAEVAGGFGLPAVRPVASISEQSYSRRLSTLPADARLLLLVAAADPLGDPVLLHRAAEALGHKMGALDAAVDERLLSVGERIEFAHPLIRSAVYRFAAVEDRQRVHLALAEATNADTDPDRRAWHRGCGTSGPNEDVAVELERSAGQAEARGGLAAAAAFLRRAAALSADPGRCVDRALDAAQASLHAGAFGTALALAEHAEGDAPDDFKRARVELVRGQAAFALGAGGDAASRLLAAAKQLEPFDQDLACQTYLDAWGAALFDGNLLEVSRAARAAGRPDRPRRPSELLLDGLATLITDGRTVAAPMLRQAAKALAAGADEDDTGFCLPAMVPSSVLWDEESWREINARRLHRARELGATARLPFDLTSLAILTAWCGDFADATSAIREIPVAARVAGIPLASIGSMLLAALRGDESRPSETGGPGIGFQFAQWSSAILCNGLARYDEALTAAQDASNHEFDVFLSSWALPELVEASVKTRKVELGRAALDRLTVATTAAGGDWALGLEARCQALLSGGETADELYRDAIERLSRTRVRTELARTHLLYGEWLRREDRRVDAREHLRTAHELFIGIGMEAFAERTRRELVATGEKVRRRIPETRDTLTPQERQIAQLAGEGLSNPEIGLQLFISSRTVEWHLRKVFAKLGISSRKQLRTALPLDAEFVTTQIG